MRALILALALALLVGSGCALTVNNRTIASVSLQRGIDVLIIHTCSEKAYLTQAGRGFVTEIIGPSAFSQRLYPTLPGEQRISVALQSVDANNNVVSTVTLDFYVYQYGGQNSYTWTISQNYTGGSGFQSRCQL